MVDVNDVESFVKLLHFEIRSSFLDKGTIRKMYEELKYSPLDLPPVEAFAESFGSDHIFCYLYSEMRYRRLSRPNSQDRIACWVNYCHLFKRLCQLGEGLNMWLPKQWLWDLVDQFVNQFKSFCAKETLTKEQNKMAWTVFATLSLLRTVVRDSSICQTLQDQAVDIEWPEYDEYDVPTALGYYAKVGLLRVHCLLGQYRTGLKRLQPIDIRNQDFYIVGTEISIVYHCAFAYLMLGKSDEAVRGLNSFLLSFNDFIYEHSLEYKQIRSKIRQMYALLAVCHLVCSQDDLVVVDAYVKRQLLNVHFIKKMQETNFDDNSCRRLKQHAWPEFTTPFEPDTYFKSCHSLNGDKKMLKSINPQECLPFDPDDNEPYLSRNQLDQQINTLIATTGFSKLKLT